MKEPITINKIKPPINVDDYNREVLSKVTARFAANVVYEQILRENHLADMLAMGYTPPTRWQKFKYRMQDLKRRIKDILTIVSGGDIHDGCC